MQVTEWTPSDIPVAQAVEAQTSDIPVAILVEPRERFESDGGDGFSSGAEDDEQHRRMSFYHHLDVPHEDNDHVFQATADLVRLSSPVKFRISGLQEQPCQSKTSKLLDVFHMWHSAHAVLGPNSVKIYTRVSFKGHHLVVNNAQKAVIELPLRADTDIDRRRTPLSFRPTAQCQSTCELVITSRIHGNDVRVKMVPFQVSDSAGFVARDHVTDKWERCMRDLVWMERQNAHSPMGMAAGIARANTPPLEEGESH